MAVKRRRKKVDPAYVEEAENAINEYSKTVNFNIIDYSFEFMIERLEKGRYYIPEYQREHIWKPHQKSRFIETMLMGLPVPFMFFWQNSDGRMEVVDGSQRLRTVQEFMNDKFALKDLEVLDKANGLKFSDFSETTQLNFSEIGTRVIILDNNTDAETRTEMFARINTGGTTVNEAEIRRGALLGPFMDLITELAEHDDFIAMTPISKARIKEREREELVTRFFAYIERFAANDREGQGDVIGYGNSPKRFFFKFVKDMNEKVETELNEFGQSPTIDQLRNEFFQMLNFVEEITPFGFTKTPTGHQIPRVRYEVIAVGVGLALRENPELLNQELDVSEMLNSTDFKKATRSDAANVKKNLVRRLRLMRDWLLEQ